MDKKQTNQPTHYYTVVRRDPDTGKLWVLHYSRQVVNGPRVFIWRPLTRNQFGAIEAPHKKYKTFRGAMRRCLAQPDSHAVEMEYS